MRLLLLCLLLTGCTGPNDKPKWTAYRLEIAERAR
jgi:hypothetical protein